MVNLQAVNKRESLKHRRDPYWSRLDKGCALGFRKMTPGSEGSWSARAEDETTGKRVTKSLSVNNIYGEFYVSERNDGCRQVVKREEAAI